MSDGTFVPSGVTAWSSYNTPRIWAMVANEDDPESWRQVAALGSMAGLLKDQASRLEAAKQRLTDAWPPESNKASAAFVELMDNLLITMRKNKEIADSNAAALGQILEALRQAKQDIEPLYQQYLKKNDDWVPGWWDNAEDELDEQARARMRAAETVIAHPDSALRSPGLYEFTPGELASQPIGSGGDSGRGGSAASAGAGTGGFPFPHDPPPPLSSSGSPVPSPSLTRPAPEPGFTAGGPDLAGVITPGAVGPPATAPVVAAPVPAGPSIGQAAPGLIIGGGLPGAPSAQGGRGGRGGGAPIGAIPPRGQLGAARGNQGVMPVAKPAPPSWLPPTSGGPPRGGSGAAAAGARGSSAPSMPLPATGGRRPVGDHGGATTSAADSPWVTAEGVCPVIEPSRQSYRHDPGPGVIGWHG